MKKLPFLLLILLSACTSDKLEEPLDCTQSDLSATSSATGANCGANDGSVELQATGGEGPYEFSVNGSSNSTGIFTGLASGNYSGVITDALGCTKTVALTISSLGGVNISSVAATDAGCNSSNGSVTITATDGTPPYTYKVGDGAVSSENVISGLSLGTYIVEVSDSNDCSSTQSVKITSGVSLANDIMPIISQNCAVSGCHNGSRSPNLSSSSAIITNAASIRSQTTSRNMPVGGSLSQTQIDMIACWVNDGSNNN